MKHEIIVLLLLSGLLNKKMNEIEIEIIHEFDSLKHQIYSELKKVSIKKHTFLLNMQKHILLVYLNLNLNKEEY